MDTDSSRPSDRRPLAAVGYALLSFASLAVVILIGWQLLSVPAVTNSYILATRVYYVLVVILGLAVAAFLFGAMRSRARLAGTHLGFTLELGGPAAVLALVVVGGFWLAKSPDEFSLVIRLRSAEPITDTAETWIRVDLGDRRERRSFSALGEVVIPAIPVRFRDVELPMEFESRMYNIKDPKTGYRAPESGVIYLDVVRRSGSDPDRQQLSVSPAAVTVLDSNARASLPATTAPRPPIATPQPAPIATPQPAPGTLDKTRFRAGSVKVTGAEAIIGVCWYCASVTFHLENQTGAGFSAAILQGSTSIGACVGQEGRVSGLGMLSQDDLQLLSRSPNPEAPLRYFPEAGKIIVTIQQSGCHAENFSGQSTYVAMSLIVASGKDIMIIPLSEANVPLRMGSFR